MLELATGDSVDSGLVAEAKAADSLLGPVQRGLNQAAGTEGWTLIPVATAEQFPALKIETDSGVCTEPNDLDAPNQLTLYSLVEAVGELTADDREVVVAVSHILHSGQARLCGQSENRFPNANFTGA